MGSHHWVDVWRIFLDVLSRESIAAQIAVGLGAAFLAVMVLEGIRASFFPKRIAENLTLRNGAPPVKPVAVEAEPVLPAVAAPQEDLRAAWTALAEPVVYAAPAPRTTVNADYARRSSPRRMRVIGQRKPS